MKLDAFSLQNLRSYQQRTIISVISEPDEARGQKMALHETTEDLDGVYGNVGRMAEEAAKQVTAVSRKHHRKTT